MAHALKMIHHLRNEADGRGPMPSRGGGVYGITLTLSQLRRNTAVSLKNTVSGLGEGGLSLRHLRICPMRHWPRRADPAKSLTKSDSVPRHFQVLWAYNFEIALPKQPHCPIYEA